MPSEELVLKKRDSVLEKLDSPRSPPRSKFFLGAPRPDLTRSITPELVPEPMHARMPEDSAVPGLRGLEAKEVPIQAMHERDDSPQT